MSSNYDIVLLDEGVGFPDFEGDPSNYEWQTKAFPDSAMRWHRLTADGQLVRATHDYDPAGLPAEWGELPSPTAVASGESAMPFDDWIRVRYYGSLRVTAHAGEQGYVTYDIRFEGPYEVASISRVDTA